MAFLILPAVSYVLVFHPSIVPERTLRPMGDLEDFLRRGFASAVVEAADALHEIASGAAISLKTFYPVGAGPHWARRVNIQVRRTLEGVYLSLNIPNGLFGEDLRLPGDWTPAATAFFSRVMREGPGLVLDDFDRALSELASAGAPWLEILGRAASVPVREVMEN